MTVEISGPLRVAFIDIKAGGAAYNILFADGPGSFIFQLGILSNERIQLKDMYFSNGLRLLTDAVGNPATITVFYHKTKY